MTGADRQHAARDIAGKDCDAEAILVRAESASLQFRDESAQLAFERHGSGARAAEQVEGDGLGEHPGGALSHAAAGLNTSHVVAGDHLAGGQVGRCGCRHRGRRNATTPTSDPLPITISVLPIAGK